jgi:predicted nuclease of predicted toxin-antitoxin system
LKLLLDMNLSPALVPALKAEGWDVVHWTDIGDITAPDKDIMRSAQADGRVVVTNDLDFGAILAATRAAGPSVVQIRGHDLSPQSLGPTLTTVIRRSARDLEAGAIVTLDLSRARVRTLPLV